MKRWFNPHISLKERLNRVVFFFPIQLLLAHFKYNQLMLLLWALLFGFITNTVASNYGIPHLFLVPEYLGETDVLAHFIVGFSVGGFVLAFNIASYIVNGARFPFIATLSRPFAKYLLNNSIIPMVFYVLFCYHLYTYQTVKELISSSTVIYHLLGFTGGLLLFVTFGVSYFFTTNLSLEKLLRRKEQKIRPVRLSPAQNIFSRKERWYTFLNHKREWRIITYLASPVKIALARGIHHYDEKMLRRVFAQNHINASFFELLVVISILFFGFYRETPLFALPAGASIVLFFTLILMIGSALYSWLKGWSVLAFIVMLIGVNQLSKSSDFAYINYAYGLDYENQPAPYNNDTLKSLSSDLDQIEIDKVQHLKILEEWKTQQTQSSLDKPKLVFVNCSGGGLRSSLWSLWCLQYLEHQLKGGIMNRAHLITGSSGGMIGAAYLREHYLQQLQTEKSPLIPNDSSLINNISKDLLNPIALNIALHDWFFRVRDFHYAGFEYPKDRGYAFERQLSSNTNRLLEKRLIDYQQPEQNSDVPIMMLSPVINNDGRRMLLSALPISFMTKINNLDNLRTASLVESVEFRRLLAKHQADSLSFLTALRMSATFPYVLPNVSLPTQPRTEVVDAGVRDNFGLYNTVRYINTFSEWINKNTSGVLIIQLRDRYKSVHIEEDPDPTLLESIINPIGRVYGNYLQMQDYSQDQMIQQSSALLKDKISVVSLQMKRTKEENISLSWHLTQKEKQQVLKSIETSENQEAISIIKTLLVGSP